MKLSGATPVILETTAAQGKRALVKGFLGRALGHFIFSLMGFKRISFTNNFQRL